MQLDTSNLRMYDMYISTYIVVLRQLEKLVKKYGSGGSGSGGGGGGGGSCAQGNSGTLDVTGRSTIPYHHLEGGLARRKSRRAAARDDFGLVLSRHDGSAVPEAPSTKQSEGTKTETKTETKSETKTETKSETKIETKIYLRKETLIRQQKKQKEREKYNRCGEEIIKIPYIYYTPINYTYNQSPTGIEDTFLVFADGISKSNFHGVGSHRMTTITMKYFRIVLTLLGGTHLLQAEPSASPLIKSIVPMNSKPAYRHADRWSQSATEYKRSWVEDYRRKSTTLLAR
ncbi:hypothetical protein M0802_001717 [Mischocyttarus mexicanus]|nr:hypothetical protein M0802_001717 [Mischocyttarus mexicanus]